MSNSRLTFATPLPQGNRSEILEWQLPKPYHQYVLTGKSRAAWHTSFTIPQLNLLLDAGLVIDKQRPKHVFITHGHNDHALMAPVFVNREDPPDIYCPVGMTQVLDDYLHANRMLNRGGLNTVARSSQRKEVTKIKEVNLLDGDDDDDEGEGDVGTDVEDTGLKATHVTHSVRHGDVVSLRRLQGVTATVFDCDHSVPCVGFVFNRTTNRLKPEYVSAPGSELKKLRQSGIEITIPHTVPMFAFLGDTTAATLAAEPEWLQQGIPVVITECSFLYPIHKAQAEKTKHTLWENLEPIVRKWPQTTFVLTHFSLRYQEKEVVAFFQDMQDRPQNIVVWADPDS